MTANEIKNNNTELNIKKRKRKTKKQANEPEEEMEEQQEKISTIPSIRNSDDPIPKRVKWTNKQRVLIISARNISFRNRHLMNDLRSMMPHAKPDNKIEKKSDLQNINEIAQMKNCSKCLYFENKKHTDLYMWMSNITSGPSIKFLVENVHTMNELKLTGNCLKGSRPLICFDENFSEPHWALTKELLLQVFGTPKGHPKSQPFFDHVFVFSLIDDKIWFRNYQIVEEDGQLTEIGPRFVLNPIKIFAGSFSGETLWSNPKFVTPNQFRRDKKQTDGQKYVNTLNQKYMREVRTQDMNFSGDPTTDFFHTEKQEEEEKGENPAKKHKKDGVMKNRK